MSIQGSRRPQDRGVTPNLIVRGVDEALEFYQQALSAELLYRGTMPNGLTLHAQLRVGASFILLSDEMMSHGEIPTGSPAETRRHLGDFGDLRRRRGLGFRPRHQRWRQGDWRGERYVPR